MKALEKHGPKPKSLALVWFFIGVDRRPSAAKLCFDSRALAFICG
jgi:hypothetical protein